MTECKNLQLQLKLSLCQAQSPKNTFPITMSSIVTGNIDTIHNDKYQELRYNQLFSITSEVLPTGLAGLLWNIGAPWAGLNVHLFQHYCVSEFCHIFMVPHWKKAQGKTLKSFIFHPLWKLKKRLPVLSQWMPTQGDKLLWL